VREHPLDPRRAAILGYSQGAYLAGFVGFRNPDLFPGGVLLASGRLKDEVPGHESLAARGLPVLIAHGEKDRFVPGEFAERGRAALDRAGYRAVTFARTPGGRS
jgi:predicted esterase